jgi:hypothetical protein
MVYLFLAHLDSPRLKVVSVHPSGSLDVSVLSYLMNHLCPCRYLSVSSRVMHGGICRAFVRTLFRKLTTSIASETRGFLTFISE